MSVVLSELHQEITEAEQTLHKIQRWIGSSSGVERLRRRRLDDPIQDSANSDFIAESSLAVASLEVDFNNLSMGLDQLHVLQVSLQNRLSELQKTLDAYLNSL